MRRLVELLVAAALVVAAAPLMTVAAAGASPRCSCSGPSAVAVHGAPRPAPGDDVVVEEERGTVRSPARSAMGVRDVVPVHPSAPLADPGIAEVGIGVAALVGAAYASSCSARTQRR